MGRKSASNETAGKIIAIEAARNLPEPPAHLSDIAAGHWRIFIRSRHPGDWTVADLLSLADLCELRELRDQMKRLADDEPVETTNSGTTKVSGYLAAFNLYDGRYLALIKHLKLGTQMSPATLTNRAATIIDAKATEEQAEESGGLLAT